MINELENAFKEKQEFLEKLAGLELQVKNLEIQHNNKNFPRKHFTSILYE